MRYWRKRADVERYGLSPSAKIVTAGGAYKSLNLPRPVVHTPFLDVYLRGDRELLTRMLRRVDRLGRAGLGGLLGAEIDDDPDDRSLVLDGAPQRSLPVTGLLDADAYREGTYAIREATLRPPYWHRASETLWCSTPEGITADITPGGARCLVSWGIWGLFSWTSLAASKRGSEYLSQERFGKGI